MTLLKIENVSLTFPGNDNSALVDINYQVKKGDFVVILGSNGSGKSSLLKLIDKRYGLMQGDILLNGKSITKYAPKVFSKKVITLTQNCHDSLFASLTVLENCLLGKQRESGRLFAFRNAKDRRFFADYLSEFNINLPNKLDQVVGSLSGGEKQALALALSVLFPPELLLLDEHTSALDPKSAELLMALTQRMIREHKMTCMMTTHDLDVARQYGNRIMALRYGKLFQVIDHDKKQQLSSNEILEICY